MSRERETTERLPKFVEYRPKTLVVIECESESQMRTIADRLRDDGLRVIKTIAYATSPVTTHIEEIVLPDYIPLTLWDEP